MQLAANVTPGDDLDWHAIDWKRSYRIVKNLRQRIFRASRDAPLGVRKCLSRVRDDPHARFCGEGVIAISPPYRTTYDPEWEPYFEKRWERQWKTKEPSNLKTLWLEQNGLCPACQDRLSEKEEPDTYRPVPVGNASLLLTLPTERCIRNLTF
jgi:hypothetical protein